MKYLITERQYNKLLVNEYGWYPGYKAEKIDPHILMTVLAIGTAFIPVAGPFISAGIGLADAAMYYKEGDKYMTGLTLAFSLIPGLQLIPGFKNITKQSLVKILKFMELGPKSKIVLSTARK